MTNYQAGDTQRLVITAANFAGADADLAENPTIKTYDSEETLLETVESTSVTRDSAGHYHYDYTMPDTEGDYTIEASGLLDGEPWRLRIGIKVVFV
jgi:hypothetical protein